VRETRSSGSVGGLGRKAQPYPDGDSCKWRTESNICIYLRCRTPAFSLSRAGGAGALSRKLFTECVSLQSFERLGVDGAGNRSREQWICCVPHPL
jgi:hypothetical protein